MILKKCFLFTCKFESWTWTSITYHDPQQHDSNQKNALDRQEDLKIKSSLDSSGIFITDFIENSLLVHLILRGKKKTSVMDINYFEISQV